MFENDQSFYIQLYPILDKDSEWQGNLQVNIITGPDNVMEDEPYSQMIHLCQLVASTIPFMEENPEFISTLEKFMRSNQLDEQYEEENEIELEYGEDNVVKINFNSRTKGNA